VYKLYDQLISESIQLIPNTFFSVNGVNFDIRILDSIYMYPVRSVFFISFDIWDSTALLPD